MLNQRSAGLPGFAIWWYIHLHVDFYFLFGYLSLFTHLDGHALLLLKDALHAELLQALLLSEFGSKLV